jgi:hypothetical protein
MKKGQVILCLMALMGAVRANAESSLPNKKVTCSVEVIADMCGSGHISIEFYQGNFILNYGDVHCWFGDFTINGRTMNLRTDHTGSAVTVDLVRSQSRGDSIVGELTYRSGHESRSSLATLVTKNLESLGAAPAVYHLQCKEQPSDIDCYESCNVGGKK